MFTGIIENIGQIEALVPEGSNLHVDVSSSLAPELKIDQSVAHDGCCLTVVALHGPVDHPTGYRVTAIAETLDKTTVGSWRVGHKVNLERCMVSGGRLDGHIVQGHVDTTGTVASIEDLHGSWKVTVYHSEHPEHITVAKGSISLNGTSLTVVDSSPASFSVHLIPYTWEHTNFHALQVGDSVNLEFDILGKYVARMMERMKG